MARLLEGGDTAVDMALRAGCQEAVVLLEGRGGRRGEQLKKGRNSGPEENNEFLPVFASDQNQNKVENREKGGSCRIS